jgi:hypothetical protein
MKKSLLVLINLLLILSARGQRLYVKPHLNFQFPLTKAVREDYLPYAKRNNNYPSAVIMPGVRVEYIKKNGNGYFLNFGTTPVGFAVRHTDYALIDPFYQQRSINPLYLLQDDILSSSDDIWTLDIGFINRIATLNLTRKKELDIKFGYGVTLARYSTYNPNPYFIPNGTNSMNKRFEVITTEYPYYNPSKGKSAIMVPVKLDFNIKSKIKDVEILNFELGYWQSLSRGRKYNVAYHNLTDNVVYDNVIHSKGSTWQMSVQIPIRIRKIGTLKF